MRIRVDPSVIVTCIICRKEVSEELWPYCSKECIDYNRRMEEEYLEFKAMHENRIRK